ETRWPPPFSVPSMTPASGMKTCTTRPWLMPSVTESSTMPIPSRSRASPCESARASPSDLPHGGLVHDAPGRHAPSLRKECTIPAVAMHHHPRSSCTFGAAYAVLPGHTVTVPILLDGIPGDLQRSSDLPLTRALQPHFANLFVNFHCDNHLYSPPT